MGKEWAKDLVHIPYGTMSFGGEKLASRTGNIILLNDVFDEAVAKALAIIDEKKAGEDNKEIAEAVGLGAVIFGALSNSRIKDINFVMEDALNFDGNTGPYVQYTYARTCSVLRRAEGEGESAPLAITAPDEAALLKVLAKFPERVSAAIADFEPSIITRYILDVSAAFNRFYHNCQILSATDPAVRATRVELTRATNVVLGNAFPLICLKKMEKI